MSRNEYFLIGLVVVLGGIYVAYFSGWFRPKFIQIEHSVRSPREAWTGTGQRLDATGKQELGNVTFAFQSEFRLNSVKVVPAAEYATNKYTPALWELVSEKGGQPVKGFAYGAPLAGMTRAREYLEPEPLQPGVQYRLIVRAGKLIAEHDFSLSGGLARRQ